MSGSVLQRLTSRTGALSGALGRLSRCELFATTQDINTIPHVLATASASRGYCKKPESSSEADRKGDGKAESGSAGKDDGGSSSGPGGAQSQTAEAAAAARERAAQAAKAAADAQRKVTDAARNAADFTRSVAQELFRGSAFGGASKDSKDARNSDKTSAGASTASSESAHGNTSSGFGSEAFARAQHAFKSATGGASSSSSTSSTSKTGAAASGSVWQTVQAELQEAVLPVTSLPSMMRKRTDLELTEIQPGSGPSELVAAEKPKTFFEKLSERLGGNPLASRVAELRRRVGESEAAKKAKELKDDVQERLETSDSDVVGRMADMRESMMTENEQALTYREVRMRHPLFDMPTFLRSVKHDVPVVIKVRSPAAFCMPDKTAQAIDKLVLCVDLRTRMAYLEGNETVLKEYCSDNMLERLTGIYKVTQAQGQITDSTILEFSDVDMVDMKMMDGDPVIILHFSCQQINCVRDQYGSVVSGSPEEVNRVYYYWAVQQDGHGYVTNDGKYIPPRWKLIEMLLRGMHQLL